MYSTFLLFVIVVDVVVVVLFQKSHLSYLFNSLFTQMTRSRGETQTESISTQPSPSSSATPAAAVPPDRATEAEKIPLLYSTEESPPWPHCLLLAFQHYLVFVGTTIATTLLVLSFMCMEASDPYRGDIVSTIIFVSGIITVLQVTFGIR